MSQLSPFGRILLAGALLVTATQAQDSRWRKLGGTAVETGLAGLAGGPVLNVWFSPPGDRLFARAATGRVFETRDFENWVPARAGNVAPAALAIPNLSRVPEAGAALLASRGGRLFALGANVFASEDGGRNWVDLTGFNHRSVIGSGIHDLTVSPLDPQVLVVANDEGVWRSSDGGLTWFGLNEGLPNLPVREILAAGRIRVGNSVARLDGVWRQAEPWAPLRTSGVDLSTVPGSLERVFVDADTPRIALAVAGARIFRTVTGGSFWDDITGNLSGAAAHGIVADVAGGAVYVATDRGVFLSRMDLNALGPFTPWTAVDAGLPAARAVDVKLDSTGNQLLVALEGYGVFTGAAPHREGVVRLANAADFTQRAAAPGSLYTVLGAQIRAARGGGLGFPVLSSLTGGSQIQVPFEMPGGAVSVTLERVAGQVTLGLTVKPVSPAIFLDRDGAPMMLDSESGLMMDARIAIRPNSKVQMMVTGLGKVTPNWPSGIPAPGENVPSVVTPVQAFLNGSPVEVTRATLAPGYVGLYLVEFVVPSVVDAGPAEFYLLADAQESNRVRVAVDSGIR